MSRPGPDAAVIVGAGPGIGASIARQFAQSGYSVGLVARNEHRLADLAEKLDAGSGATVRYAIADATDPDQVRMALRHLSGELGAPSALCFTPIPDVGLIKPVTETRPEEFMESLQLNIAGAAAAVETVLPDMLRSNRGSLLFTTGSAAIQPHPDRAASAVTTTAATVYISLLRQALHDTPVRVGHTVIVGPVDATRSDAHHPDGVAADVLAHHRGVNPRFPSVLRLS